MSNFTNRFLKKAKATLLLSILVSLSSCSVLQAIGILPDEAVEPSLSQTPYTLSLTIKASPDLNNRAIGDPAPVRLRLFLTDAKSSMLSESFESVFDYAGSTQAATPLAIIVLTPGQTRTVSLSGMMSQDQLVVAAAFHDVYSATWIAEKTIDPHNPGQQTVEIGSESIDF